STSARVCQQTNYTSRTARCTSDVAYTIPAKNRQQSRTSLLPTKRRFTHKRKNGSTKQSPKSHRHLHVPPRHLLHRQPNLLHDKRERCSPRGLPGEACQPDHP